MVSISNILVLGGMLLEIVGGFILSVEAIGLDRLASWINSLSLLHSDIAEDKKVRPFFSRGSQIPRIICGLCAGAGVYISVLLSRKYFIDIQQIRWYQALYMSVAGGLIGGVLGVSLLLGLEYGLRAVVFGLRRLEDKTRARSSGILGFLLLLLGFLLQFAGTLGQTF